MTICLWIKIPPIKNKNNSYKKYSGMKQSQVNSEYGAKWQKEIIFSTNE